MLARRTNTSGSCRSIRAPASRAVPNVDDRDLLGLGPERDPQRRAAWVDRDMPGAIADSRATEHTSLENIQGDNLAAGGIRHVGMPAVRMSGGVARLAETVKHMSDGKRSTTNDRDRPDLRVGDDRHASDALDTPRLGQRLHIALNSPTSQFNCDKPRFLIGCHER